MSTRTHRRERGHPGIGRTDRLPLQIERLDRLIGEAETRLEEQEAYVREVALVSGSTAVASFELQKMQLLVALLREGRQRLSDAPALQRAGGTICVCATTARHSREGGTPRHHRSGIGSSRGSPPARR